MPSIPGSFNRGTQVFNCVCRATRQAEKIVLNRDLKMKKTAFAVIIVCLLLFNAAFVCAQKKAVNPDSAEDVAELIADAESGDRGAQYDLSMVYTFKQDGANALKWLIKSAENGYGRAQYTLGNLYYNGSDKVKRNYEKAIEWFEASKETKHKGAKVDELIASAKKKIEEEKKAAAAKKRAAAIAAETAKKKAAEEKAKKEKEALEAEKKAAQEAEAKAVQEARGAEEAALKAAQEAATKAEEEAKLAEEASKSVFRKVIDKILNFFD